MAAWLRSQRAQTLTEFALISPLIFLLLFGVMDLGRAIYIQASLNQAANEGARVAIRGETPFYDYMIPSDDDVVKAVKASAPVALSANTCVHGPIPTSFSALPANQGWIFITEVPAPTTVEASPSPNAPGNANLAPPPAGCNPAEIGNSQVSNYPLQVTIYYNFVPVTPLISQFATDHIILKADAVYRTEY